MMRSLVILVLLFALFAIVAVAEESATPDAEPAAAAPEADAAESGADKPSEEEEEAAVEPVRTPPPTVPMDVPAELACSACSTVIDEVWYHVKNVSSTYRSRTYAERYFMASRIIDGSCDRMPDAVVVDLPGNYRNLKSVMTRRFHLVFPEPNVTANETASDEPEKERLEASEEDSALLKSVCRYMIGNQGSKLKSKVATFGAYETDRTLKTSFCVTWQPDVCNLPPAPFLDKRQECLLKLFAAIEEGDWEATAALSACALKEPELPPPVSQADEGPAPGTDASETKPDAEASSGSPEDPAAPDNSATE